MRRFFALLIGLAVVASSCSGEGDPEAFADPATVVASWLETVDSGDVAGAEASSVHGSVALVLALENDLPPDQAVALIEEGIPLDLSATYWSLFRRDFAEFAGRPMSSLTVGDFREFEAEGVRYAAVTVRGGAESEVLTRWNEERGWGVDLVATLAPGMVGLIRRGYESLPDSDAGRAMRSAYLEVVGPAIWAALTVDSDRDEFAREALALLELIDVGA